jgi:hypothetical protein
MLILVGHATTPDKLKLITSAAGDIDTYVSYIDCTDATPPVPKAPNKEAHNITTAATTDILAGTTTATDRRNVKQVTIRNVHATIANDVTVVIDAIDGSDYELHKATLSPGEMLEYHEGIGWFEVVPPVGKIGSGNASTAAQGPGFATDTYVTGSNFPVTSRLQAGSFFRWLIAMSKTAAGTAAPTFNIRFGTAGAIGDTSRCLFTGPAQSAVVDTAQLEIIGTFRAVGASAIIQGELKLHHNLAVTGFATVNPAGVVFLSTTGGTFDSTVAASIIGLSMNGGTSAAWTVTSCVLDAVNLLPNEPLS